jgi:hypothetical protein
MDHEIEVLSRRSLAASLVLFLSSANNVAAQEKVCTLTEAMAAENVSARLKSWTDVYNSFKRFGHCDDGAIAEGYSDSIIRLLVSRWNLLGRLQQLASLDNSFHAFVLRHIDATADELDIKRLIGNATKRCPAKAKTLCAEVEQAARAALRDLKNPR